MNILISYATASGTTAQAATLAKQKLIQLSPQVSLKDIRTVDPVDFNKYDLVILASPTWWARNQDGMPHEFFLTFMDNAENEVYSGKKFAVMGLGDNSYPYFCRAVDVLEDFIKAKQGTLAIESLRLNCFSFDLAQNTELLENWLVLLHEALSSKM